MNIEGRNRVLEKVRAHTITADDVRAAFSEKMGYKCDTCKEVFHYADEVVFDKDELKTVDEANPDWDSCTCTTCFHT